jgi:hypothetical protein
MSTLHAATQSEASRITDLFRKLFATVQLERFDTSLLAFRHHNIFPESLAALCLLLKLLNLLGGEVDNGRRIKSHN